MSDIFIVGAGPAGLMAAVELGRRGFRPRIVDKAAGHPIESRALAVHSRTLQLLQPAGLTDAFLAAGNRVSRFIVHEGLSRPLFSLEANNVPGPYPFVLTLPQADTERLLVGALDESGIHVEWQTKVEAVRRTAQGTELELAGPHGAERVCPGMIIAADGAHSLVRKSLGIPFDGQRVNAPFALADVEFAEALDVSQARVHLMPTGVLAFFPIRSRLGRYVATNPATIERLPDGVIAKPWEAEFNVSYRHAERFRDGNVFLVGDAAHIHSPVGGRGMNLGIEDSAWLAWLLECQQLDRYERVRLPVARQVLRQTQFMTQQIRSTSAFRRMFLRWVVPGLLSLPVIRSAALRRITAQDTPPPPWLAM